ncbi:MAG: alpha/beta fold hydrolase [Planctomycetes bacterium]|nr:alpha/beta fold hydrolase [Planctomycetota bacterium]
MRRRLAILSPLLAMAIGLATLALAAAGCVAPHAPRPQWEDIQFLSADDVGLHGSLFRHPTERGRLVVLLHQLGADRATLRDFALNVRGAGYNVLTLDLRGHGESVSRAGEPLFAADLTPDDFVRMAQDLSAAVAAARARAHLKEAAVALVGFSLGANVAWRHAAGDPTTRAVALVSPGSDIAGLRLEDGAAGFTRPLLVVAAEQDVAGLRGALMAQDLAGGPKQSLIVAGAAHGQALLASEQHGAAVRAAILDFLARHLAGASPAAPPATPGGPGDESGAEGGPASTAPSAAPAPGPDWKPAHDDLAARVRTLERDLAAARPPWRAPREDRAPPDAEEEETPAAEARAHPPYDRASIAARSFGGSFALGAYADAAFTDRGGEAANFEARSLGLLLRAGPAARLNFFGEVETLFGGDVAGGDGGVQVNEALVEYEVFEPLRISGGVVKVPLGAYNQQAIHPLRDFATRPLTAEVLVPAVWSEPGLGVAGTIHAGAEQLEHQVYFINGPSDRVTDGPGVAPAKGKFGPPGDNNDDKTAVGRVAWRPGAIPGLSVAPSLMYGDYDVDAKRSLTVFGLDGSFCWRGLTVAGEGFIFLAEKEKTGRPIPQRMQGYFVEGTYRFWFDALNDTFLGRGLSEPAFFAGMRYEQVDTDTRAETLGDRMRAAWVVGFRPHPAWALKLEYAADLDRGRVQNIKGDQGLTIALSALF